MKNKLILFPLVAALSILSACNMQQNNSSSSKIEESSAESSGSSQYSSQSEESESSSSSSEDIDPEETKINDQNPNAKATTIAKMISDNNKKSNTTTLYRITAVAQWATTTYYGNLDMCDDTGYIYVYGCSKTKTTIKQSGSTYSFTNDGTYDSMNIRPGDVVTMEGLYVWYSYSSGYGVSEFQGYVTSIKHNNLPTTPAKSYTADEPTDVSGDYYSSISSTDSGSTLETKLHNLMDTTHTNYISYSSLNGYYSSSDKHSSGGVKCFYSGQKASSYNKEHVWAQSLSGPNSSNKLYGEDHGGSDLHHVRPTIATYNSIRSSASFGEVYGNKSVMKSIAYSGGGTSYCTGNVFEPADNIKGDIARIIMYMYIHYSNGFSGGNSQSFYGTMDLKKIMGPGANEAKKMLRKWNAEDPVSQDEITRNNYAYSVQKNRNPFIDHPKLADRMWA